MKKIAVRSGIKLNDMAEESTRQGNLETGLRRPSPNHGTQRLPNDDDDDDKFIAFAAYYYYVGAHIGHR